jgi:hypothetical protein
LLFKLIIKKRVPDKRKSQITQLETPNITNYWTVISNSKVVVNKNKNILIQAGGELILFLNPNIH